MTRRAPDNDELSGKLRAWGAGDAQAEPAVLALVYDRLRRLANASLRRERVRTLDATELVHELWMRWARQRRPAWSGRVEFFACAARVMRQVLIDRARRRLAAKRGGAPRQDVTLSAAAEAIGSPRPDLLALDEALTRLAAAHARPARVVELRYFAGLSDRESAALLGLSDATVRRDLRFAEAWLRRALRP
jgi:RNA polymerase sigma factor (TIGR02999 family)